jgi:serine/threonine-protein kinase
MRDQRPILLRGALALVIGLSANVAMGQPEMTRALSRTAFEEGMKLVKAGAYPAACAKLEDSLRLDPQMGTRFWLADCYEHLGRTASAWSNFVTVASDAKAAGNAKREATARARADALLPGLPRLVVMVPEAVRRTPGLEITRDGSALAPLLWGTPMPVDPGEHKLRASAAGKVTWEVTAMVGPGGARLDVPPLRDAPAQPAPAPQAQAARVEAPPAPPAPSVVAQAPAAVAPPAATPGLTGWRRVVVPVAGSVGGVGIAVGGITGALALTTWHSALALCKSATMCSAGAQDKKGTASTYATVSDVGFAFGGAGAVVALVAGLTAPRGGEAAKAAALWVAPAPGGIAVGGAFR